MIFLSCTTWPLLLRCNARTRFAEHSLVERESSSFNHYRSPPKRKDELMRCTCCLLYSWCDQRQLDAMIACQCPLARLVTLEVDWSLWRDPNFVGHPTWLGVTDWKGTLDPVLGMCLFCSFLVGLFYRGLTQWRKKTKNKLQSLLKVLQSLLHLPEQEQFVKTSAFLHERVSKLQLTHAL